MTDLERKAWAEQALLLSARAGGLAAMARQQRSEADRLNDRRPEEAEIHRASAERQEAGAKVAAELAELCRQRAEDTDV